MCFCLEVQRQKHNKTAVGLSNSSLLSCLTGLKLVLAARIQSRNPAFHHFVCNMLCDFVNETFLVPSGCSLRAGEVEPLQLWER